MTSREIVKRAIEFGRPSRLPFWQHELDTISDDPNRIRAEVRELVEHWGTPDGGFIVFNYGDPEALSVSPDTRDVMFRAFAELTNVGVR